jgi:hypothetical protein
MANRALESRQLELRYQLRFRIIDAISRALDQLIPGAAGVLIVYFGIYRPVHALASKQTLALFGFKLLVDTRPNEMISYLVAFLGWMFGINAQRLRRNTTARLTYRIQELERRLDPNRTTSGLTPRGQTPAEPK